MDSPKLRMGLIKAGSKKSYHKISGSLKLHRVNKRRPKADCFSDHELIAKFRLKLKKVRKTTRRFKYNLNQIPYNYTVGVTNRFKGIDLIDRMPEELWMEVCDIVLEAGIKTILIVLSQDCFGYSRFFVFPYKL